MSLGWSSDFSYGYFKRILRAIKSNFESHLIFEAPRILNKIGQPKLILRHDVDVSLRRALRMAEIEKEFGICATYMVMINSPLYHVEDVNSRDILLQLIQMRHEIGLHFCTDNGEHNSNCEMNSLEAKIHSACKRLEKLTDLPVLSISFHRPKLQFLRGPLRVSGRINAYSRELMEWYLSDSKGCWREGEPLPKLLKPNRPLLQLLIHPIWWGNEHMLPEDRLQEFFDTETQGQQPQDIKAFDVALATITGVQRRFFHNETKGEK